MMSFECHKWRLLGAAVTLYQLTQEVESHSPVELRLASIHGGTDAGPGVLSGLQAVEDRVGQ